MLTNNNGLSIEGIWEHYCNLTVHWLCVKYPYEMILQEVEQIVQIQVVQIPDFKSYLRTL